MSLIIVFLSSFHADPRSKKLTNSKKQKKKKKRTISWKSISLLNVSDDTSSRPGKGVRMSCLPWGQSCACTVAQCTTERTSGPQWRCPQTWGPAPRFMSTATILPLRNENWRDWANKNVSRPHIFKIAFNGSLTHKLADTWCSAPYGRPVLARDGLSGEHSHSQVEWGGERALSLPALFSLKRWGVSGSRVSGEESSVSQGRPFQTLLPITEHPNSWQNWRWAIMRTEPATGMGSPQRPWPPSTEMRGNCDPELTFPQSIAQLSQHRDHSSLIMGLWSVWPQARKPWKCPLENICFRLLPVYRKPHMLTLAFLLPSECGDFRLIDLKRVLLAQT